MRAHEAPRALPSSRRDGAWGNGFRARREYPIQQSLRFLRLSTAAAAMLVLPSPVGMAEPDDPVCNGGQPCVCPLSPGQSTPGSPGSCATSCYGYTQDVSNGCCNKSGCNPLINCNCTVVLEVDGTSTCSYTAHGPDGQTQSHAGGGFKRFRLRFDEACATAPEPFWVTAPLAAPPHTEVIVCGITVECKDCPG
jgi:hypothetical protein